MDIMKIITQDLLSDYAHDLCALIPAKKIFTFSGPLGAGKTTLVRLMLRELGVVEPVQSPTYTYVNIYKIADMTLYHFDLYRINSQDEFFQAGFDEYLDQPNSYFFIEWPEIIETLLEKEVCRVFLEYNDQESRLIKMEC